MITKFNGKVVSDQVDLIALVRKLAAGTAVPVEYSRDGSVHTTTVVLIETS
ncbi:PDZ domain-containing protein [Fodinicola feengrottensis]|uniref:PDZ domain-containing protein n=1 Tax=Fodinicola feengrottensis TaxID=435914 RepID=UPI0013D6E1CB|nr:PDZ domain-containing protein [Fodinicola feengrottensis]